MDHKNRAFSLIELAIVLTVIALLTTIAISAKKSLENSKLIAFIDQIENYKIAYEIFVDKYGAPPGDIKDGELLFQGGIDAGSGTGSGLIDYANAANSRPVTGGAESNAAWQHLKLAGLIMGNFPGTSGGSKGINYPECKILADCSLHFSGVNIHNQMAIEQNYLATRKHSTADVKAIPVAQAYAIDLKVDDGRPFYGWINSYSPSTGCSDDIDADWSSKFQNSQYKSDGTPCAMIFALDLDYFSWD